RHLWPLRRCRQELSLAPSSVTSVMSQGPVLRGIRPGRPASAAPRCAFLWSGSTSALTRFADPLISPEPPGVQDTTDSEPNRATTRGALCRHTAGGSRWSVSPMAERAFDAL